MVTPSWDESARGFTGLLFEPSAGAHDPSGWETRDAVADLNLTLVVDAIAGGGEEPDYLTGLLLRPLHDSEGVMHRQEIFRDLDDVALLSALKEFTHRLHQVRTRLVRAMKVPFRYHREGLILDSASLYCDAITTLVRDLGAVHLRSRGLRDFHRYVSFYTTSPEFAVLADDTRSRRHELSKVQYTIRIRAGRVDVRRFESETDYSAEILSTFERFQQGAVKDYRVAYRGWPNMDHVGAQILDLVARLYAPEFAALDEYCERHSDFIDESVRRFERELQFFLSYLAYVEPLKASGLAFCLPDVSAESKEVFATDTFDVALAKQLDAAGAQVVRNDFRLEGRERIFVVSGPNQGGKTTFARTFGQLHHLASLGCPVPGSAAKLFLFDRIFTHFEREENLTNMRGKLEDDLVRIHRVLQSATSRSIVIMNEIFTSTTLNDAQFLGTEVMRRLVDLDLLGVYVTFVDEIASSGPTVVSMVSAVVADDPVERTYRVVRGPADGLAYALALAEKFDVTYERLKGRIRP